MNQSGRRQGGRPSADDPPFIGDPLSPPSLPAGAVELTGGTVNGRYRLTGSPSQWAVGTAHPAVDLLDHELVVLVYPNIPPGREVEFYRRAAREVERTRTLRGTSLVCMRDCGALANTRPYFVMQRVQAHSVQKLVADQGPVSVDLAVQLVDQIMILTHRAHGFGFVLGDIRPANIFVTETRGPDGRRFVTPTVVDTGYARGLFDGLIDLPEPPAAYRSPQRRRGERATAADDIYALGALLSFLVTGRAPRVSTGDALDPAAWGPSRIRPDLRITPLLDRVVLRCLEPRPELRWRDVRTMQEAAEALRQVLTLPPAARALLDEMLSSPPMQAGPSGTLAGMDTGPRSMADVPTRELDTGVGGTPEAAPQRTGTIPFDPRDVAAALLPRSSGDDTGRVGARPRTTEELRRLLRVIDSPDSDAEGAGASPLEPPRFGLVTSETPSRELGAFSSDRPARPPAEPLPSVMIAPTLVERRSPNRAPTPPAGTTTALASSRLPARPVLRVPTDPLPAPGLTERTAPARESARVTSTVTDAESPRPQGALPRGAGRIPVGDGEAATVGSRPLELPAEAHTIPQADDQPKPNGLASALWRYGVGLGVAATCVLAGGLLLLTRNRSPDPVPFAEPVAESGYLPSAPVSQKVAPNAAQVAPNAAQVAPNAAQVAPNAAQVAPNAAGGGPSSAPGGGPSSAPASLAPGPSVRPTVVLPALQLAPSAAGGPTSPPSLAPRPLVAPALQAAPSAAAGPTSPTAAPGRILVGLESRPAGARVLRAKTGEVLCAATPCTYGYPQLKPGTKMRLRLEAPGFAPLLTNIRVDVSENYNFELSAAGPRAPERGPPNVQTPSPTGPASLPF